MTIIFVAVTWMIENYEICCSAYFNGLLLVNDVRGENELYGETMGITQTKILMQSITHKPDLQIRGTMTIIFILNQNICCGYSNEPSQRDDSFKHP